MLAALGPKNVALAAEVAEAWEPLFFPPESAAAVWGKALAEGQAKRDPALGPLDLIAETRLAIGDDVTGLRDLSRPAFALYIGGMGAKGRNSTTTWSAASATRPRRRLSRRPTWQAAKTRPPP